MTIKETMREQGLTQAQLRDEIAALSGASVALSTLSDMARGERRENPFLVAYLALRAEKGPPGPTDKK